MTARREASKPQLKVHSVDLHPASSAAVACLVTRMMWLGTGRENRERRQKYREYASIIRLQCIVLIVGLHCSKRRRQKGREAGTEDGGDDRSERGLYYNMHGIPYHRAQRAFPSPCAVVDQFFFLSRMSGELCVQFCARCGIQIHSIPFQRLVVNRVALTRTTDDDDYDCIDCALHCKTYIYIHLIIIILLTNNDL